MRKRRILARLLILIGSVLVSLLIVEVALRIIGFRYLNLYQDDPYLGFALRPGAEGWWRIEGETYIKINSDGLRDRPRSKVKPPNTVRIAVLGDSFAEALQVPMENAFWAVAEQKLAACKAFGDRKVEVVNFGVSGFSTARELIMLRQRVWNYSPDIVVLIVTTRNDIRDNSRFLNPEYARLPLPYFVYKNGDLILDDSVLKARNESLRFRLRTSSVGRLLDWFSDHLRLIGLINQARAVFQNLGEKRKQRPISFGYEPGLEDKVFMEPPDPAWTEAWRITEGLMLLMRDEVEAHGAKFLIVTGSTGIQVYPNQEARRNYMRALGVDNLFYAENRIAAWGAREQIQVFTLAPRLENYADQNRVFLHGPDGFGHWNVMGHRVVGEQVAEKLCEIAATTN